MSRTSSNSNEQIVRRAVFVGSFAPFHKGHKNIVERALQLFDEVVIGVSINEKKSYTNTLAERVASIEALFHDVPRVKVKANEGLTVDFAHEQHAQYIIKGVRNVDDFLYEQQQAQWNKAQGGVETLLLVADEGLENISSTAIREKEIKHLNNRTDDNF